MKDNIALGSTSTEENVEIVIAPPYKEMDEKVDLSKDSSTSMVLCGNVEEKKVESSTKEKETAPIASLLCETRNRRFILYRAALEGDWSTAEKIYNVHKVDVTTKLSKEGDTALHIAAAAKHTGFVKKLLEQMKIEDLAIKNNAGNTAFFLAAASGEIEIVKAMMKKNGDLAKNRGNNGVLPLHKAALMGNKEIVQYLYGATEDEILDHDNDRIELLISLVNRGLYDIALDLIQRHPELATARDKNEETALHSLARMPVLTRVVDLTAHGVLKRIFDMYWGKLQLKEMQKQKRNEMPWRDQVKDREKHRRKGLGWRDRVKLLTSRIIFTSEEIPQSAFELIKGLWKQIMLLDDSKISEIIRKPWPLLFEATKQGNLAFLNIIFGAYPDMIFEVDENHYSIFHFAVLYRHHKIFKIIHEIGSFRDLVIQNTDKEGNNILHLAARLPPSDRPSIESGVALQLQEELLWFKEVKEILHPLDAEATNEEGKTARAIFTEQHKELKDKAERWIKDTVNSCLMAATIIATVVFAAAFTVPGGSKEETGTPHFVRRPSFIIFAISDAIALILSSYSILRFLSVISSRYAEEDFISLLPRFLGSGLAALSLSISAMMVVFCATMFIVFKDGMLWIPILVTVMAYFMSFMFLEKVLIIIEDVVRFSNNNSSSLFKSSGEESLFKDGKKLNVLNN